MPKIAKNNKTQIILQPKMPLGQNFEPDVAFNKFYEKYEFVRLIPQTHKFLNIR